MKVPSEPTAARSTCLKVFQQGVWLNLHSSTLLLQSPVACVRLHFIVFRASPLSAVYMSQETHAGVTEIRILPFVCLSTYSPWNKFVVVYSGMFRTRVQIWFQLEFPCNVPNLIKLMRGFFSCNFNGIPCFCAHILGSALHTGSQGECGEQEVTLHLCRSLCSRTLTGAVRADVPEVTGSHSHLPSSCLAFPSSPFSSVFWYGQRSGFRNWS